MAALAACAALGGFSAAAMQPPAAPSEESNPGAAQGRSAENQTVDISEADDPWVDARAAIQARLRDLDPEDRDWVVRVQGLMSPEELGYFLDLEADYRRAAFKDAFWRVRDPDGLTPRNELRERFEELMRANPRATTADPRIMAYLLNGPPGRWTLPDGRELSICYSRTSEFEIWFYGGGERTRQGVPILFLQRNRSQPYQVWRPGMSLRPARRSSLPTRDAAQLCADDLARYATAKASELPRYDQLLERMLTPPQVSAEWLSTFRGRTTEIPKGAQQFAAQARITFPARNQSRTAVQVELPIPRDVAPGRVFEGVPHHDLRVVGEVLRNGELFETFSYRFDGPSPAGDVVPIGFQRYLRPGEVELQLLVHDVYGDQYAHFEATFEVPSPTGRPPVERPSLRRGEEGDEPTLALLSPSGRLLSGKQRFTARATGEIDRVAFLLDDRQVLSKGSPPFSVELDLGELPAPRRVRVVGYRDGEEVATDQLWINQSGDRLRVELVEPRPGGIYPGSLTARAEVVTPDGSVPTSVEFFLGDRSVGRLQTPPYETAIELQGSGAAVVRAVATLADGSSAEEAVVVNAGLSEQIAVRLVEVPVVVLDSAQRPVEDLNREDFRLFVDDRAAPIESFYAASVAPLDFVFLIDRSSSMQGRTGEVRDASMALAQELLQPSGSAAPVVEVSSPGETRATRVAVMSFSDQTSLDQTFTASVGAVERALASIRPLGGTALNDALLEALNLLAENTGGVLVVFTDGRDENSRFGSAEVLAAARARGAIVYAVALVEDNEEPDPVLDELSAASGGRAFALRDLASLERVFGQIRAELSGRYLLTFTASGLSGVHTLRVELAPGAAAGAPLLVRSRRQVDLDLP